MTNQDQIAGFSDLLTEFSERTGINKKAHEIELKFYMDGDYLCASDGVSKKSMVLATFNPDRQKWSYFLPSCRLCRKFIQDFTEQYRIQDIAKSLNEAFKLYRTVFLIGQ